MLLRLGLVVAKREKPKLTELKKYLDSNLADVFLFPEGYFSSEQLVEVQQIVQSYQKWLVTSMEDLREPGKKYQTGVVIDPEGCLVGEHKKTSITDFERRKQVHTGSSIDIIPTMFGKIGIAVCYEIQFPEVSRIYALHGARIIFNPIGVGMYHERQVIQWTTMARARAIENGVFVCGCSHDIDAIPIAYLYDPEGECLVFS